MSLVNSKPHLTRQMDLISDKALQTPITIIGAGAVGSWVTLLLAKMGMENITVFDHDVVSIENVSCQLYGKEHIDKDKVHALARIVEQLTAGTHIKTVHLKWTPDPLTKGIVICAVDSMETRREIFEAICKNHFFVTKFIDCRMGAETALMYTMNPFDEGDRIAYRATLYTDADAVQEACTAKATGYTASLISGWCVKAVKNIITEQAYPRITLWSIKYAQQTVFTKYVCTE